MLVNVEIKGPRYVAVFAFVPLESYYAPLKGVHAQAIVSQFLISVFNLIEAIYLILKTYV